MRKTQRLIITAVLLVISILLFSLPAQAAKIGGEGGFYYSLKSDKTATLEEYRGGNENITIPSNVYSYTVNEIAENTFSNNTTIKTVVIPESVTTIGAYSFFECTNLESVIIPTSVTSIYDATFYGSTNLTEVIIPASVTQIAANAFIGCDNLTIKSESGSYAETYANENGITFIDLNAPEPPKTYLLVGDADCDGDITSADSLYVLRMSVQLEDYKEDDIPYFDVDADNKITSADSLDILRFSVELSANERIGKPI